MKKAKLLSLMFLIIFVASSTVLLVSATAITTKTPVTASFLNDVQVDRVDHMVKILEGGSIAINDTVRLSAKINQTATLGNYSLGFPYVFKNQLADVFAFNTSNPLQVFNVSLDTGLKDIFGVYQLGFYGVTVIFPQPGVHLFNGSQFSFTVVFVFSNVMTSSTTTLLDDTQTPVRNVTQPAVTMDFPVYPSLPQNITTLNMTVICPRKTDPQYTESSFPIVASTTGDSDTGKFVVATTNSVGAFAYQPGWMNLTETQTGTYRLVTFDNLARLVQIDGWGNVFVTDTYKITSQMLQATPGLQLHLPQGASNVSGFDAQGNSITVAFVSANSTNVSVSFGFALQRGQSSQFKLTYYLSSGGYLTKVGTNDFDLNLPVAKGLDRVAGKFSLTVSLPEGASIKQYPTLNYDVQNNALQQAITVTASNVTSFNNDNLHMAYVYSVFWASFRPTLWISAFVAIGMIIAFFWTEQKPAAPTPVLKVTAKPQTLKGLVSSYEERTKILLELDSLERQAQKGRLPRRRYKIRKRMLESQMARLDRELVDLKQRAKSMGPRYAEILKDLEIAEAELEGIEAEERRAAGRYRAGAMTLDAYRNMQEQYKKRRDKAKTTIEGALLRLREGIA